MLAPHERSVITSVLLASAVYRYSFASRLRYLHGLTASRVHALFPPDLPIPEQDEWSWPESNRHEAEYRQSPSTSNTSEVLYDNQHQCSGKKNASGGCCCQRRQRSSRRISVEEVGYHREDDHGIAPDIHSSADDGNLECCLWIGGPAWLLVSRFARFRSLPSNLPIQKSAIVTRN